jgi:phosphoribosyl 1,2-cyclic phosphodiesterase
MSQSSDQTLRVTFLASGSQGNCALVEAGDLRLLVDAGISFSEMSDRMRQVGLNGAGYWTGLLLTHRHGDHAGHAEEISRKLHIPVWPQTDAPLSAMSGFGNWGKVRVHVFGAEHGAEGSLAYGFTLGDSQFCMLTDAASIPDEFGDFAEGCSLVACECNHNLRLLKSCGYPEELKRRVEGRHLSNAQVSHFFAQRQFPKLKTVVLLHLSVESNSPSLALAEVSRACPAARLLVASQDTPLGPLEVA